MTSTKGILSLLAIFLVSHVACQPVGPPSSSASPFQSLHEMDSAASSSLSYQAVRKTVRTPSYLERKLPYRPRVRPRQFSGTPRQQVEQMRYNLPPRRPNESEEQYQAKKAKKERMLQVRKTTHLEHIALWEQQHSSAEEVARRYNDWIQSELDRVNFLRAKAAMNRPDLTIEEYQEIRRQHKAREEQSGPEYTLFKQNRSAAHRKYFIKKNLEQGDKHKAARALERMQKHNIADLKDGRTEGARKGALRKFLRRYPEDKDARDEAIKMGMDPDVAPAAKRKQMEGTALLASISGGHKRMRVEDGQQAGHPSTTPAEHSSGKQGEEVTASAPPAKKDPLPFDLNEVPLVDQDDV
jgi:hypothetical protein